MTMEERANEKRYLTTKEFIREVNDLGFDTEIGINGWIWIADERDVVAVAERNEMYKINTDENVTFNKVATNKRKKLFDLLVDYASTPLDERVKEQRFFLKFKIEIDDDCRYLNYYKEEDELTLDNSLETSSFQTLFTDKELEKLKEKFEVTLSDFEKIPFKDKEKEKC
jgi:hypothetical protein